MHSPLSPDAPTAPRRVFCAGLAFLIIDGRRVWSEPPPPSMKSGLDAYEFCPSTTDPSLDFDRSSFPDRRRS